MISGEPADGRGFLRPVLRPRLRRAMAGALRQPFWSSLLVLACACAVIAGTWAVTLERIRYEREDTVEDAFRDNTNLVRAIEEHTLRTLKGIEQTLRYLRHEFQEEGPRFSLSRLTTNGVIGDSLFHFLGIMDEHGTVLAGTAAPVGAQLGDREYFLAQVKADRGLYIGKPIVGRYDGRPAIPISMRLTRRDGSFAGVVYVGIDPSYFTALYRESDLGDHGLITLVRTDGVTLARRAGRGSTYGQDMSQSTLLGEQRKQPAGVFFSAGRLEGVPRFYSYRTVGAYGLIVAVGTSQAERLRAYESRARNYRLAASIGTLLVIVFTGIVLFLLERQQRSAEGALRASARFAGTFEQATVGITLNALDGTFLQVNRAYCRMLGYTESELIGRTFLEFLHPDERPHAALGMERILSNSESSLPSFDNCHIRKDGSVMWATVAVALVRRPDGSPDYTIAVVQDVTARKTAEAASRESEGRFRQLAENITQVFWLTDITKNEMLYVSPAYETIWQRSCADLYANPMRWLDAIHPEDRAAVREAATTKQALGEYSVEYRIVRPDGSTRWISDRAFPVMGSDGTVVRVAGIAEDVTERRRAEAALRESERRFRDMLGNVELVSLMLDREGRVLYCNDYFLRITGWTREEVIGQDYFDRFVPAERAKRRELFARLIADSSDARHHESDIVARSGERRLIRWNNSVLRSEDGEVIGAARIGEDITEQKRAEAALRESQEQFEQLAQHIPEAFWITDAERNELVYLSPAYERVCGHRFTSLATAWQEWKRAIHPEDRERTLAAYHGMFRANLDHEYRVLRPDGSVRWVHVRGYHVRNEKDEIYRVAGTVEDITDRHEMQDRLEHQTHHDSLTGLPNRVLCFDRLGQAIDQAKRKKWNVSFMFLDLDRFKNVNDTLGHDAGDEVLLDAARRLRESVRGGDTVARLGGDEFGVVLTDLAQSQDAAIVAKKIIHALARPFLVKGHEIFVTASIGIASYPVDSGSPEELVKNADAALFQAKLLGRNNHQFYAAEMNARAMEKLRLESKLRQALERGEFSLHFQPKMDLETGELMGVEALLRWGLPGEGLVPPAVFVPLLEESGLIVPVGEWVLEAGCGQARAWQDAGLGLIPVAVNLSAKQFRRHDIIAAVKRALDKSGIDPALLELEITESAAMENPEEAAATLAELKRLGVRLSIDDFGTGYSSLSYLKRFPLDSLKIDRSFVMGLPDDVDDASISRAVIAMAHSLDMRVIAEGVETEAQQRFLAASGCDEMQGYYLSRPLPAAEITAWAAARRRLGRRRTVSEVSHAS